ncbi:hypothetical protein IWX91DRAFT_338827 [Phyllosticta citricarpa]
MAEIVGLVASCATVVETIDKTCKMARNHMHSDRTMTKELGALIAKLSSYKGLIEGIKLQAELDKDDEGRLSALACVDGPLQACHKATERLEYRLGHLPRKVILGKVVFAKVIDDETAVHLKKLNDTFPVLQLALESDQRVINSKVYEYVMNTGQDVSDVRDWVLQQRDEHDAAEKARARQKMEEWLATIDPRMTLDSTLKNKSRGSGKWFLDHDFTTWIKDPCTRNSILWLRGRSGMGKTTLLSLAIDHLRYGIGLHQKYAMAFFYCSYSEKDTQSAESMLKSYVRQILDQFPEAENALKEHDEELEKERDQGVAKRLFGKLEEKRGPQHPLQGVLSAFGKALEKICALADHVVLFLDALNESEGDDALCFFEAISWCLSQVPNCRIIVSSTEALDPFKIFGKFEAMLVDMEEVKVNEDIAGYISENIDHDYRLRRLPLALKERFQHKIGSEAHGSFRWAECQLHALKDHALSPRTIETALNSMSPKLEDHYLQTLRNIPETYAPFVGTALLWLRFAVRPMTIEELREAMTLDTTNPLDVDERLFEGETEGILKRCGSLISYDAQLQRAQLAHDSVRQFLLSDEPPDESVEVYFEDQSSDQEYLCCLMVEYLSMPLFSSGPCKTGAQVEARWKNWPLFPYNLNSNGYAVAQAYLLEQPNRKWNSEQLPSESECVKHFVWRFGTYFGQRLQIDLRVWYWLDDNNEDPEFTAWYYR